LYVKYYFDGNWSLIIIGDDYENIDWLGKNPAITKKQFEDGFAQYDAWKTEQDAAKAAEKQALLDRLGISASEAKLLLG
jgi:oligoribonuclease NrnB/cAMP/cGMP phosphodiesterase (DHH superfamily)